MADRSSAEIRASLERRKAELDRDIDELGGRLQESLSPRRLVTRHPAIVVVAGVVLGFVVFRRPDLVVQAASRIAKASVPLLLSGLLRRGPTTGVPPGK